MRVIFTLILTVVGFWAAEFAIFHTRFYPRVLSLDSTTGQLESHLENELVRPRHLPRQVVTIGDSRMGFFTRYADAMQAETGYEFATVALAGTTPRDWYYMLRTVDPAANKYSAVVIGVDDYEDQEALEDYSTREADLHYLIARLKYSDIPDFSTSYPTATLRWAAMRSIVLKGLVYKRDFQDFLLHPTSRLQIAAAARRDSVHWYNDYVGTDHNLAGVSIDWKNRTLTVPAGVTDAQKAAYVDYFLGAPTPTNGKRTAYMHQWLGKIYGHYRGSKTRLVFLHLPRGPFVRPDQPAFNPHSSIRELATQPGVTLMPEHIFDSLERPDIFMDERHLNGAGCAEFSRILAREISKTLHAL